MYTFIVKIRQFLASNFTKLAQKPPLEVIMLLAIIKLQPHFQFVFAKTIIDIVQIPYKHDGP